MNFDLSRQGPLSTVLFLALLIAVFWGSQVSISPLPIESVTPFERALDGFALRYPFWSQLLTAALVFVVSLQVARLSIRNVIYLERTYLPALIYLVLSSGYYCSVLSMRPFLTTPMIIFGVSAIISSYNSKSVASGEILQAGFWFGLATMFFLPAMLVFPILFVGLMMFRFWDLREWVAGIMGFLLPVTLFAMGYIFGGWNLEAIGADVVHEMTTYRHGFLPRMSGINVLQWAFVGTVLLLFILSWGTFFARRKSYNVKPYISFIFFVWFAVILSVGGIFTPLGTLYLLPLLAIPVSVIVPSFFNGRKPTFLSNFLYAMFIVTAIALSLLPLIAQSLD